MKIRPTILASLLLPSTLLGDVLVNLDATALPAGPLVNWTNTGTVGGTFTRAIDSPVVGPVGGVQCVTFDGTNDWYVGPTAPASVTGTSGAVTIEVWALNPSLADEETMISWGRRGGPDGTNRSFNFGQHATWGAVGQWGGPDVGWGTTPPSANQWHYLVYTYDGSTTRVYEDGALKNSEVTSLNTHSTSTGGQPLPFVVAAQNNADGTRTQNGFNGSLSIARIRVRNEVLSPAQITSTFLSEGDSFELPPKVTSFTTSAAVALPGQDITLSWQTAFADTVTIDNGVGDVTGMPGSIAIPTPGVATTYTITATNEKGSATAQVVVAPFAPIQITNRWDFNEASGNVLLDSVGGQNGNIVNQTAGAGWTRVGGQVQLPGGASASAPYIDLPNNLLSGKNEVTLEGWMTINGSQNWSRVLDFGTGTVGEITAPGGTANGTSYIILSAQIGGDQNNKRLEIQRPGLANPADVNDPASVGQQFHFAIVYDADGAGGQPQLRYYKNGNLTGSVNTPTRLAEITNVNNWLGRSNFTGDNNTQGSYNEFRVWNGALSASVLADHAAAGPNVLPQVPRVDAFTAIPGTVIYRGEELRLSYVVADPTGNGLTMSIDQGVGPVAAGAGFVSLTPTESATYTLTATNSAGTRTSTVNVTVLPSEPVAEDATVSVPYQTATPIVLKATDPNSPPEDLLFVPLSDPAHGAISGTAPNLIYTPAAGYSGVDSFTFYVSDGVSDSNIATVQFIVDAAPTAPNDIVVSQDTIKTSDTTGSFIARLRASDVNTADTHTFSLVSGAGDTHNAFFSIINGQLISQHNFAPDLGQNISVRVRATDNSGRTFDKVIVFPVVAATPHVLINEIHYNPPHNHVPVEFVELYNPLATSVDVGGWRLTDGVTYTIPAGTSIPAGGYLVLCENPAAMQAVYGVTALGPWSGGLSADGERVTLRNQLGALVDEVDYQINFPWPVIANGEGPSMELVHPSMENDLGSSWRPSNNAAAAVNYITAGSTGWRWRGANSEASNPVTTWRTTAFVEDGTWATGTAPLGSAAQANGIAAPATALAGYPATYRGAFFRKTFTANGTLPKSLLLRVYHNDGAIVWLNGQEVARLAVSTNAANPPFNNTQLYDNFTSWSEIVITGADTKLVNGTNVLAIQAWGKVPSSRENDTVDDFIIDAELRNSPDLLGTPGAQNSVFAANAAPNIRNVLVTPAQPDGNDPAVVTARVTDPQGVGAVTLHYQVCAPGAYIPARLPLTTASLIANPFQERPVNPAFENPANWTSLPMVDDGTGDDLLAGDGIYTATIPAQAHRSLVRYRITVTDIPGASLRAPYADDPSLNFAYFVYNGVPNYVAATSVHPEGNGHVYPPAVMNSLPVYHWITRPQDMLQLMAWSTGDQIPNDDNPRNLAARRYENHEGALVYDGKVYDHVRIRLRGGNSRYNYSGKRHFKLKFLKGYYFQAHDQRGNAYPTKWQSMQTNKLIGNISPADWGLPQELGRKIFGLSGAPMPYSHWFQFRVIDDAAEQADQYTGDFWGISQAIEDWDGRFLEAHDLEKGNLYKLTDFLQDGELTGRYLTETAVQTGEDYDNYRYGAHPAQTESWLNTYVDMPQWYRYSAAAEAVRHYDVFPEPTGRHRLKNWIWYFRPDPGNALGKLVTAPYDLDATFGPTWNNGWDGVKNALYNHAPFGDSPIINGAFLPKPNMQIQHRNAVRHLRDLLWQPDQLNAMIDEAAAVIEPLSHADRDRWINAPATSGFMPANLYWSVAAKAQNMKDFAFSGGNWAQYGGSQPVDGAAGDAGISGQQGRDAYLDYFADQTVDAGLLPSTPTITYTGTANYPVDGLSFSSSAFSDPQGAPTFGAMQWRIGEITDPSAPAYDPLAERIYEIEDVWVSAENAPFNASISIPASALKDGHTYRARVRHKDNTGRWSHWSAPVQFTTTASNYVQVLKDNLMISEFMYKPAPPTSAEVGFLEGDFEYIELLNISSSLTLDLSNVRFTKGVDFNFSSGSIQSLPPGGRVLVVKSIAAFNQRYGTGRPVAGEWDASDNLSNGGEQLKLSFGSGDGIHDFEYDNASPWPAQADLGGYSLVLINPASRPNHGTPGNWRASSVPWGTPGFADRMTYAEWSAGFGGLGELVDTDRDGVFNLLEYAFGGHPLSGGSSPLPVEGVRNLTVGGVPGNYLTLTFRRNLIAEDLTVNVQFATDLAPSSWQANGVLVESAPNGDGTITQTWRAPTPISASIKQYGRVQAVK